jgi:hypothetical protein
VAEVRELEEENKINANSSKKWSNLKTPQNKADDVNTNSYKN